MSDKRTEPSISLTLDEDDIAQRAQSRKAPAPERVSGGGGSGGGAMVFLLALMTLALAAAAYYLYDQLVFSQQLLDQSRARLDVLEERLSVAGENLEENSVTTQVKLKELDGEVRKLWDNVWKKQKEELAQHDKSLNAQAAALKKIESDLAVVSSRSLRVEKQVQADKSEFASTASKVDRALAQAEVNRKQLLDVSKQLTSGGSLDARVRELERQLQQTDEWLESVNAFRRQVNRDIESLRQTMTQYHSSTPQP